MTDNFLVTDLIRSVRKETTVERYLPIAEHRETLLFLIRERKITYRDEVTEEVFAEISARCGEEFSRLFARFLHLYDFNPQKLREIRGYEGSDAYEPLAALLRLPGVRIKRAELYYHSGVTLQVLASRTTTEIQGMVRAYVEREHRPEIVPLTKEVNCHRVVAAMILHTVV